MCGFDFEELDNIQSLPPAESAGAAVPQAAAADLTEELDHLQSQPSAESAGTEVPPDAAADLAKAQAVLEVKSTELTETEFPVLLGATLLSGALLPTREGLFDDAKARSSAQPTISESTSVQPQVQQTIRHRDGFVSSLLLCVQDAFTFVMECCWRR